MNNPTLDTSTSNIQERRSLPSLLWPANVAPAAQTERLTTAQAADLALDVLVRALDATGRHSRFMRQTLMQLVADPAVIAYRQAVVADLAAQDLLRARLRALLPRLSELGRPRSAAWAQDSPLLLVPPRLTDLELYVACINDMYAVLQEVELQAEGWQRLRDHLARRRDDPAFTALEAELPALRAQLDEIKSVTIGVNLDGDLRPVAATLVAIHREAWSGPRTLTHRLLGRSAPTTLPGTTTLRSIAERAPQTDPLARDLEKLLAEAVQPLAAALERFARIEARPLAILEQEFAFLLGAIDLAERLTAWGLPVCLPTIDDSRHYLHDSYNPCLALQIEMNADAFAAGAIVRNTIDFEPGRIVVLTGPNRGGKTTYLRAVGINQILFQSGIFVAAAAARMTPADAILTHFPAVEDAEPGGGRLDDEARRLREIFEQATPASLLLFNEPLTSTGEREAYLLGRDVLRALRLLGARTVYVTHLYALAAELSALNTEPGATIVSWVAGVCDDERRTFEIRPGVPHPSSHAALIARQHGITYEQLAAQVIRRQGTAASTPVGANDSDGAPQRAADLPRDEEASPNQGQ